MKAYSQDLREHVLRAVDQGLSRTEIVRIFGVSSASIKRYLKQRNETGNLAPKAIPGRPPKKLRPRCWIGCNPSWKLILMQPEMCTADCGKQKPASKSASRR